MKKIFWLYQLLFLLWEPGVMRMIVPVEFCVCYFLVHHIMVKMVASIYYTVKTFLWKLSVIWESSLLHGWGGIKKLYLPLMQLFSYPVISAPLYVEFHQDQSQLVKTLLPRHFVFNQRTFSPNGQISSQLEFLLVKDQFRWYYQMKVSTVLANATF